MNFNLIKNIRNKLFWLSFVYIFYFVDVGGASVKINNNIKKYEIQGNDYFAIVLEIQSKSPLHNGSKRNFGSTTDWTISWKGMCEKKMKQYQINKVNLVVDINTILPKWKNKTKGGFKNRHEWNRFSQALNVHEDGHKKIILKEARRLERSIFKVESNKSCKDLYQNVNILVNKRIDEIKNKNRDYDFKTDYGRKQKARVHHPGVSFTKVGNKTRLSTTSFTDWYNPTH